MSEEYQSSEWSVDEWTNAWSIKVGRAYGCGTCGNMIMVTKGGLGNLDPECCGAPMKIVTPEGN